ncbi:MAG: hypothetical protein M1546_02115 [Chloroflexi bacterium]|nr:hypothetical protein [Chloroflexota bacterium]
MRYAQQLTVKLARQKHPLAGRIDPSERLTLIEGLKRRLDAQGAELDLSPASLNRLEEMLIQMHGQLNHAGVALGDEELMTLIRELMAYIGQVLVVHAKGEWRSRETILGEEIVFANPAEAIKGGELRTYTFGKIFPLSNIAASSWDAIATGIKPKLYQDYLDAVAKRIHEKLS